MFSGTAKIFCKTSVKSTDIIFNACINDGNYFADHLQKFREINFQQKCISKNVLFFTTLNLTKYSGDSS